MAEEQVWGITVASECAGPMMVVKNNAGSNSRRERRQAQKALEKLAENNCNMALSHISDKLGGSNSRRERRIADKALDYI